jgi:hypothetical protein
MMFRILILASKQGKHESKIFKKQAIVYRGGSKPDWHRCLLGFSEWNSKSK